MSVHVTPRNDFREHDQDIDCWCEPRVERVPGKAPIVIHNAADGREAQEKVTGEISAEGADWLVQVVE